MKLPIHFSIEGPFQAIWPDLEANTKMPAFIICDSASYEAASERRKQMFQYYVLTESECKDALVELLKHNKEVVSYVESRWKEYRKASSCHLKLV